MAGLYLVLFVLAFLLFLLAAVLHRAAPPDSVTMHRLAYVCLCLGLAAWVLVSVINQARHLSAT